MSQQINLYESRLRPQHQLATARNLGFCALFLVVVITAVAGWASWSAAQKVEAAALLQKQVVEQQEKLTALSKANAERRVSQELADELDRVKAALAAQAEVMEVLESGRLGNTTGFSALMSGFARQTQQNLWLTSFLVARGGEDIEIRGRVLDPAGLPAYVQRLGGEPVFQGRRFFGLEMHDKDAGNAQSAQPVSVLPTGDSGTQGARAQTAGTPPRFVEFVLRSEHVQGRTDVAGAGRGGAGQ